MKINRIYSPIYHLSVIFVMAVWMFTSCGKEELSSPGADEVVSLEMTLNLSDISTRALADFYDGLEPADAWEAAVDGQILYRVTVFLTRYRQSTQQEEVIGFRDIDLNSTLDNAGGCFLEEGKVHEMPTKVKLVFDGKTQFPGHPGGEILKEGVYSIYAIANWSSFTTATSTFVASSEIENKINGLISGLKGKYGLPVTDNLWTDFINLMDESAIKSSGGNATDVRSICRKEPMPLTYSTSQLYLKPGANPIGGSLIRTRARVRIEMTNESKSHFINVSDLSFGKITREQTFLFEQSTIPGTAANVPVGNNNAIVPFTDNLFVSIPGLYNPDGTVNPKGANNRVLFDAYIFESRNTQAGKSAYKYSFKVSHSTNEATQHQATDIKATDFSMMKIDPKQDNALVPITEIKRNQLLRIKITARYNEALGDFEYEVSPWTEKNGNIQFH